MLLSIIVPVYNVSKYLSKCLDSLLLQNIDLSKYEIIIVDDGSTDDSGLIADKYASQYSNIVVIHKTNGGLSDARNKGIDIAKGQYIQFVDSDDYLEPNVLGILLDKIERYNLDVLRYNYQNVNDNYQIFEPYKDYKPFVDYSNIVTNGEAFLNDRLGYGCYAWQFIINRQLLIDKTNYFKYGIYFEDTEWTPRMLLQAKRVSSTNLIAYNYLLREGSITKSTTKEKKLKVLSDKLLLIDSLQSQMRTINDNRWHRGMISTTVVSVFSCVISDFYEDKNKYLKELKQRKIYPLSKYHISKRISRKISIINLSPKLYCWLLYIKNSHNRGY
ncbi:MAG: glycosyltransferase [Bacteroidia bacterium]|nr:glycosyltransferase [Bacteroidia bacterium]